VLFDFATHAPTIETRVKKEFVGIKAAVRRVSGGAQEDVHGPETCRNPK